MHLVEGRKKEREEASEKVKASEARWPKHPSTVRGLVLRTKP